MTREARRLAILAEGTLDFHHGKTAISILRYRPEHVVAVIDSDNAGRTTGEALGLAGDVPICRNIEEAQSHRPNELVIGIAPRGGVLPDAWRRQILAAITAGLDVTSGLHSMLRDDPEFVASAAQHGVELTDVRQSPTDLKPAESSPRRPGAHVVTFVGSDCAVGKMTAALELTSAARAAGLRAAFVATGQTGIMLEGSGIAIDRVIGDFMAGAAERLVVEAAEYADWIFVEGQGSLLHPAYSGVTLSLLHGSAPDSMILVHPPARRHIEEYGIPIPPLPELVRMYEEAASWVKPCPVVAIALNTRELDQDETLRAIRDAEALTGLPATDPVKYGAGLLVQALTRLPAGRQA